MAACEYCGLEIGTQRTCPYCHRKQLKYAGTTEGPDMTFWMKDIGKVAKGAGKLIKNAHDRHKEQKEIETQKREKAMNDLSAQLERMSAEAERESHDALPDLQWQIQNAIQEEEEYAQEMILQIKSMPYALSTSEWGSALKKAKVEANTDQYSSRMRELVEDAESELVSEDLRLLKRNTNYTKSSSSIKKAWSGYAKKLQDYVEEHYSNTDEYKQFIREECYDDVEKMVSDAWSVDKLELPKDANHAIAFISYAYNKMMDMDLDSDRRKEWKKCYHTSIKQAKESFQNNADVMALVSKASEVKGEYVKANLQNALPAKIFGGFLLFIPLIACLCMESTGWGIFLAICWTIVYFFVGKGLGFGDLIREIFKKSKIKMILWWVWLFLTFFFLLAGEELDFEWYHYVITVVASLIVGFVMIEVEA